MSKDELEVKEANELRAKLGLKPLKPWEITSFSLQVLGFYFNTFQFVVDN